MRETVLAWRREDGLSVELLRLAREGEGWIARSDLVDAAVGFALSYRWSLDAALATRRLDLQIRDTAERSMRFERLGPWSWSIDGTGRPDLDGCVEIDLAVTPFCNTLALRRLGPAPGGAGVMTALYVAFPDLTCTPSYQCYQRLAEHRFRYIDLGVFAGLEAELSVDSDGLIERYEGLFTRV